MGRAGGGEGLCGKAEVVKSRVEEEGNGSHEWAQTGALNPL